MSHNQLPPDLERRVQALINLYGATQKELEAAILRFGFDDLEKLQADMLAVLNQLDEKTAAWVSDSVWRIVMFETRRAERLIHGPKLSISKPVMNQINQGFYLTFAQQNQQIRDNLTSVLNKGFVRGATLEDRRAFQQAVMDEGIKGLVRADGSKLSIQATAKAMVRTRVNQLQNETHVERYRQGGIKKLEFQSGGYCKFTPVSCNDLDGDVVPIDDIPDDWLPPRHLYGNSRVIPVVE